MLLFPISLSDGYRKGLPVTLLFPDNHFCVSLTDMSAADNGKPYLFVVHNSFIDLMIYSCSLSVISVWMGIESTSFVNRDAVDSVPDFRAQP